MGKIQYSVKYNGKENYYNGEIKPTKYDIHNTETDEKIIKEKEIRFMNYGNLRNLMKMKIIK